MSTQEINESDKGLPINKFQWKVFGFLLLAMAFSTSFWTNYQAKNGGSFWDSGAYFVLVPGAMASIISIVPWNKNKTGFGVFRGTMITVLATAILLREGFICVIMALPLIIAVVALVSYSNRKNTKARNYMLAPLLLVGFGGEGIVYDLPSSIVVEESRTIDTTSQELMGSFDLAGELPSIEPLLFKLPFPKPTSSTDGGGEVGSVRTIEFAEMGSIKLMISERTESSIAWTVIEDTTPLADWMTLNKFTASWVEVADGVQLTVEIDFERTLAPAFYFGPLEEWGVSEFAEVILDMIESNLDGTQ